jgi:hypothetical protein
MCELVADNKATFKDATNSINPFTIIYIPSASYL